MAFDFLSSREKFLVLDISSKGASGLYFGLDDDRNLVFERFARRISLKKAFGTATRNIAQKSWEGKYFFKSRRKVIAVAGSDVATTIPIPFRLTREVAAEKEPLALAEFENMIAQAMAKIFNQCRAEAGRRLASGELDTILVGAKAGHMLMDGHAMADPVGRPGKNIALLLELTFTVRRAFEDLKPLFNSPEEFFFMESPQAELLAFAEVRPLPLNLIVIPAGAATTPPASSVFIVEKTSDGHPVLYREMLSWDFVALIQAVSDSFGVGKVAAEELYETYRAGMMSEAAARHFKKIIEPEVERFFAEVAKAKLKGSIYMDAPYALPFDVPRHHGAAKFEAMPINEVMDKLGFSADFAAWPIPLSVIARNLSPFFGAYFHEKGNSGINKKLRRRLHWLTE